MSENRKQRAERRRSARRGRYEALFDPTLLACAGLAASLAFLFQPSLALRSVMFVIFVAAAMVSGKRVSPAITLLVMIGIVLANLLVPVGRVLVRIGPFAVTEFSLLDGLGKAVTFEGLIHISKASILPGLRLPGRLGSVVAHAFLYYERILEYRGGIHASSLVSDADRLLLQIWDEPLREDHPEPRRGGSRAGLLILSVVVASTLVALLIATFVK